MLRFSEEIGQPVQLADGSRLGVLRDLTVNLDDADPFGRRLVVRTRRRVTALVEWDAVTSFEHTLVQLGTTAPITRIDADIQGDLPLEHGELLLGRDVLDTQVVDVAGSRLARVGDILLTRADDERLLVGAVDVGFGAVCGRLGLGAIARRFRSEDIAWSDLHLTSARGHQVQLRTPKAVVHRLDDRELAVLLSRVSVSAGADVLAAVAPTRAGAALAGSHPDLARKLMGALEQPQLDPAIDALPAAQAHRLRRLRAEPSRRRLQRHRRPRDRTPPTSVRDR